VIRRQGNLSHLLPIGTPPEVADGESVAIKLPALGYRFDLCEAYTNITGC